MGLRSVIQLKKCTISKLTLNAFLQWTRLIQPSLIRLNPSCLPNGSTSGFSSMSNSQQSWSKSSMTEEAMDKPVKEAQLPVVGQLSMNKFQAVKNGGNGMSKALNHVASISAECLQNGGVIAVPTDTIYGVACLAQNTEAVGRIYEIKNRNFKNPVAISVGSIDDIYRWSKVTVPREVLSDLLPGPVTVVFERSHELNPALNPQTVLVGIRIPNHLFIQSLAEHCKAPIALTSANISGTSSCLQVEEFENLWPKLDLVVNGGKLSDTEESRSGSTVVDLSMPGTFHIIRPGSAHKATLTCLLEKHKLKEI